MTITADDLSGFDADLLREVVGDPEPETTEEIADDATAEPEQTQTAAPEEPAEPAETSAETVSRADFEALQARLAEQQEREARTNQRLDMVLERIQQPKAEPEEEKPDPRFVNDIDPDEDPLGHLRRENEVLRARIEDTEKQTQSTAQETEEQLQQRQFLQALTVYEAGARKQHADYEQAIDFLRSQTRKTLDFQLGKMIQAKRVRDMGEPERNSLVEQQLRRLELNEAKQYLDAGLDPALAMYEFAQAAGYAPEKAEEVNAESEKLAAKAKLRA